MTGLAGLSADAANGTVMVRVGVDLVKSLGSFRLARGKSVCGFLLRFGIGGFVNFGQGLVLFFQQGVFGGELRFILDVPVRVRFQNRDLIVTLFSLLEVFAIRPRSEYLVSHVHRAEDDNDQDPDYYCRSDQFLPWRCGQYRFKVFMRSHRLCCTANACFIVPNEKSPAGVVQPRIFWNRFTNHSEDVLTMVDR